MSKEVKVTIEDQVNALCDLYGYSYVDAYMLLETDALFDYQVAEMWGYLL